MDINKEKWKEMSRRKRNDTKQWKSVLGGTRPTVYIHTDSFIRSSVHYYGFHPDSVGHVGLTKDVPRAS
jgi:hypothetical protein